MGGGVLGFFKSRMSLRTRGGQSRLLGHHGGRQGRRDVRDVKKFRDVQIRGKREKVRGKWVFTKNVNLSTPPSVAEPFEDQTGTGPS
ncbi:vesicle transport protein USE1-like [Pyrus ussuriensis x Pyrus communis]|uniref:Vesicle transport protein USE1-like n=1 Tax=Pyrus ussuriensis x Pyrus communis TaxID=2448454 RepID=A0A5N5F2A3_9ROSA|nr:vesicle transport protein USE1-like [Pyrus ussuriensis x Pyrus communis]